MGAYAKASGVQFGESFFINYFHWTESHLCVCFDVVETL